MATPDAASISRTAAVSSPTSIFLMTHTFETGGSERQFAVLAQNLSPERFQLHVGCIRREGPFAAGFEDAPEFRLGGSLVGWTSLRTRLRLARHLRRNKVKIAHAFEFYANLTLIPAARLAGVPVVIGSHRQIGDLMSPAHFRAQLALLRWCDAVVCNSQAAADRLVASGLSREKTFVIGNALLEEAFIRATPALPPKPGVLRVGMVARMNAHYKNHSGFLRIAARIREQMPNVEFVLAGDGPLRQEIENETKRIGLRDSVIFLGDRRDIPSVNAALDVPVLTSDSESLSNVILEAMAAERPVVAYRGGGNPELVNAERGALVAPGNEADFADAVLRLLKDPALRQEQGRNAHKFVEENFGIDRVRSRFEQLYMDLLKRKVRGKSAV